MRATHLHRRRGKTALREHTADCRALSEFRDQHVVTIGFADMRLHSGEANACNGKSLSGIEGSVGNGHSKLRLRSVKEKGPLHMLRGPCL